MQGALFAFSKRRSPAFAAKGADQGGLVGFGQRAENGPRFFENLAVEQRFPWVMAVGLAVGRVGEGDLASAPDAGLHSSALPRRQAQGPSGGAFRFIVTTDLREELHHGLLHDILSVRFADHPARERQHDREQGVVHGPKGGPVPFAQANQLMSEPLAVIGPQRFFQYRRPRRSA